MLICFELEQHAMQNANRSDCERANKQTGTQKEQQWKLEKENSNETSTTPPPLSPTVFQQYSDIRHRCSCNMTVAHPRDLLRCMEEKHQISRESHRDESTMLRSFIGWLPWTNRSLLSFVCDVIAHTCCFPFSCIGRLHLEARRLCQITVIDISHIFWYKLCWVSH